MILLKVYYLKEYSNIYILIRDIVLWEELTYWAINARDAGMYGRQEERKSRLYARNVKALTGIFQEEKQKKGGLTRKND